MNHFPGQAPLALTASLSDRLMHLRTLDGFDPKGCIQAKATLLNAYFKHFGLKAAVVAVSGGIDSAVVLALVKAAAQQPNSPIEQITPVLLPVHDTQAATNQGAATSRGWSVCEALSLEPLAIDLSPAHACTKRLVDAAFGCSGQGWASGQLVAYQRTPALYYLTSLLSERGLPAVLVGTTNYDEGAYLGYFGKASDGLTDLQLISDAHKSEVFELGRCLGVPPVVLDAVPTGDMYDGRVDEQVFGATYDAVELYLRVHRGEQLGPLDPFCATRFDAIRAALDALHRYNAHKYLAKSPAVHLDVLDRSFPGSWSYSVWEPSFAACESGAGNSYKAGQQREGLGRTEAA